MSLLRIQNLAVSYGQIQAVRGLSLNVQENELVAVIGSNGAGKSTTLRALSGLLPVQGGEIEFAGKSLLGKPAHQIAGLGLAHCPEGRKVFAGLSVHDNLLLGAFCRFRAGVSRHDINREADSLMQLFPRLGERRNQAAQTLSGGEQQMLAIARALMGKPKLLILDEPSMGLAPIVIDEVFRLIERLQKEQKLTILLVEQLALRALKIADRAYVIEQGQVLAEGTPAELRKSDAIRKAYLGGHST